MQQHFVPKSYLALFTDPATPAGKTPWLWIGDLRARNVKRRAPTNVCVERDYHAFKTADGERDTTTVEHMMRDIESGAAPLLRRLAADPTTTLDNVERRRLSTFMGFMFARVPRFRNWFEGQVGQVAELVGVVAAQDPHFEDSVEELRRLRRYVA